MWLPRIRKRFNLSTMPALMRSSTATGMASTLSFFLLTRPTTMLYHACLAMGFGMYYWAEMDMYISSHVGRHYTFITRSTTLLPGQCMTHCDLCRLYKSSKLPYMVVSAGALYLSILPLHVRNMYAPSPLYTVIHWDSVGNVWNIIILSFAQTYAIEKPHNNCNIGPTYT